MMVHLEGNTSSMHTMVLLQMVCNALVRGTETSLTNFRFVDLKRDSGEGFRVFDVDEWSVKY